MKKNTVIASIISISLVMGFYVYDQRFVLLGVGVGNCPYGVGRALQKARLELDIPLRCREDKRLVFSNSNEKIIEVFYKRRMFFNAFENRMQSDGRISTFVLQIAEGRFFVLSHNFTRNPSIQGHLSQVFQAPLMRSSSEFDVFSDIESFKTLDKYCIRYKLKFPFEGTLQQCPREISPSNPMYISSDITGTAKYQDGAFKWSDALLQFQNECFKYFQSDCSFWQNLHSARPYYLHFGSGGSFTAIKVKNESPLKVEYYLFSTVFYGDNQEKKEIAARVYPEGRVVSKAFPPGHYRVKQMFEMLEGM